MRGSRATHLLDNELLRVVQRGLYDESLPTQSGMWIYRVGSTLLALKNESSDKPEVVFCEKYGSGEEAKSALAYLKDAATISRERTDSCETINRQPEWLSIAEALDSP